MRKEKMLFIFMLIVFSLMLLGAEYAKIELLEFDLSNERIYTIVNEATIHEMQLNLQKGKEIIKYLIMGSALLFVLFSHIFLDSKNKVKQKNSNNSARNKITTIDIMTGISILLIIGYVSYSAYYHLDKRVSLINSYNSEKTLLCFNHKINIKNGWTIQETQANYYFFKNKILINIDDCIKEESQK